MNDMNQEISALQADLKQNIEWLHEAEKQRDELTAALKAMYDSYYDGDGNYTDSQYEALEKAAAALSSSAKARAEMSNEFLSYSDAVDLQLQGLHQLVNDLACQRDELARLNAEFALSMAAAANWIRNCSTPLDAAKELELALSKAKARGQQ